MTQAPSNTPAPQGRRWATLTAIRTRTMVVSVCALVATLWQGYAIQKHNRLMVQPILDTELNTELDGSWVLLVQNSGLGPARVTRADILVDNKPQPSTAAAAKALGLDPACMGSGSLVHFYRVNQRQMVLSSAGPDCRLSTEKLGAVLKRLSITLHYESLYGDPAVHQVLR
ncbi:hypothetical protein H5407_06205 [Mitsuaria sp. WAJ17]|uniref:hypothetical protein n=1 Tax=Mitsuaria sp. WAJ17 TaxID=2761452 RepID=UPI0016014E3D|nr:hypothetical protein [Mitsuaria sp. WAJ17]MBB2484818.1 hypothetical protein [Mitsuaria sp. WAJ17]